MITQIEQLNQETLLGNVISDTVQNVKEDKIVRIMINNEVKDVKESQLENCVMCGIITDVPKRMPIDFRRNYVECCGQLCPTRADKVNKKGV